MSKTSVAKQKSMLDEYVAGDFFLASPNQTMIGKGIFSVIEKAKEAENQLLVCHHV